LGIPFRCPTETGITDPGYSKHAEREHAEDGLI
jgi:hypothetical protein